MIERFAAFIGDQLDDPRKLMGTFVVLSVILFVLIGLGFGLF